MAPVAARPRGDGNDPAVTLDNAARDRQAQTAAIGNTMAGRRAAIKAIEDMRAIGRIDTRSRVDHIQSD